MLKHLSINNYALIDKLRLDLPQGLTIITGETGAGKSIIMGALSLLSGERTDSRIVTDQGAKTVVEATFDITGYGLENLFEAADVDYVPDDCILRREVSATGRSRAFVNDTPVTVSFLRDLATHLVDIHSQHSNMLLATPGYQLQVLDSIADNSELLLRYREVFKKLQSSRNELLTMQAQLERDRAEADYLSFQYTQLAELNLLPDEDESLEAEQTVLANVETLKGLLWETSNLLSGEEHSLLSDLHTTAGRLEAAAEKMPELAELSSRVRSCEIELKDISSTVVDAQERLSHNPERLQQIDDRLNVIYSLERKHNIGSVNELLALQQNLFERLSNINAADEHITELKSQVDTLTVEALSIARILHEKRVTATETLNSSLVDLAAALALNNLKFVVDFNECELNLNGNDNVNFLFAFNRNQKPVAMRDAASGGEISRVMLCIKTIMARVMQLPTIIFDEVDTGVSGDVADKMGRMMSEISNRIQVLAITHLPQVAACADTHMRVYKTDETDRTITNVERLDETGHLHEVARMLSGHDVDRAAISNAQSLISGHSRRKNSK